MYKWYIWQRDGCIRPGVNTNVDRHMIAAGNAEMEIMLEEVLGFILYHHTSFNVALFCVPYCC